MAYGNTTYLDMAATTFDQWVESNALDLFSAHNQAIAILLHKSELYNQETMVKKGDVHGNNMLIPIFGQENTTVTGVTRANQVNQITPTVPGAGGAASIPTASKWVWSHYIGMASFNERDRQLNSSKSKVVDMADTIRRQIIATFYNKIGTDIWDAAAGSESKLQSIDHVLLNTGSPGGIDQTDTTNNDWWLANVDTTSEPFTLQMLSALAESCVHDNPVQTGIQGRPDVAFLWATGYNKAKEELRSSQRVEVTKVLKGGAAFLEFDEMMLLRETRITSGTGVVMNSRTWRLHYDDDKPTFVTPGFVPDPSRPAMYVRNANWFLGLGCESAKHNGRFANKE